MLRKNEFVADLRKEAQAEVVGMVEEILANGSLVLQTGIKRFVGFITASTIFRELRADYFNGGHVVEDIPGT